MNLPRFGVCRPVTITMIFLGIIVLGIVSLSRLGLDLMPELEMPAIGVYTSYSGAGPEEVEKRITEQLEERLSTVPNLDKITSVSREGLSIITLTFDWGTNMDEASNDVRDYVGIAKRELPEDIDEPVVFKFDFAMMPILIIGVTADESYPRLEKIAEDKIADPLKRIPGVATALVRGGLERQILVEIDKSRLKARHLAPEEVIQALRRQNLTLPGGHLDTGRTDYLVRVPEEFKNVSQIQDTIVSIEKGAPIYLKDVACVSDSFAEQTKYAHVNKRQGVMLVVQKQSGANTVQVAERVLKELPNIKKNLPADIEIKVIRDFAEFIRLALDTLASSLYWGAIFVFLIILFFLRRISGSLIIAVAIPCSLIISFILMYLGDYTLNIISLSSLVISVGMVVDAAIVILDNIYRHHQELQRSPKDAAIHGADEVALAVIASTLTTIVVFLPIIFVQGVTGVLFKQMAMVVSLVLLASLFTALTFIPMLASKFILFGQAHERKSGLFSRFYQQSERWFNNLESAYRRLLAWALNHQRLTIRAGILIFASSLALLPLVGSEFFPETDSGFVRLDVERPVGTSVEETGKVMLAIEEILYKNVPEIQGTIFDWGYGRAGGMSSVLGGEESSNTGWAMIKLMQAKYRQRSNKQVAAALKPLMSSFAGTKVRFSTDDPMEGMLFGSQSRPLLVEVRGYDLLQARQYCTAIAQTLEKVRGVGDVEISRKEGKPELAIIIDREKAARLGVNVTSIANTVRTYIDGTAATQYREGGDEYDIFVRLRRQDRSHVLDLGDLFVSSASGKQIELANIAQIKERKGPIKIERKGQERIVYVSANIYGRDLGSVVQEAEKKLSQLERPAGFSYAFSGAREEQLKAFRWLGLAFILGVLLVYMVMASLFESFKHPLVILFSIPFALSGVIWGLLLTHQRLNVDSLIGIILLVGIVVNNAIVLIDYTNTLRKKGARLIEAIKEAGKSRLRPVLMTTITTVVGLLPLTMFKGEGAEEWRALSIAVVSGLSASTLITLVFVPTLYAAWEKKEAK